MLRLNNGKCWDVFEIVLVQCSFNCLIKPTREPQSFPCFHNPSFKDHQFVIKQLTNYYRKFFLHTTVTILRNHCRGSFQDATWYLKQGNNCIQSLYQPWCHHSSSASWSPGQTSSQLDIRRCYAAQNCCCFCQHLCLHMASPPALSVSMWQEAFNTFTNHTLSGEGWCA